MDPERRNFTSDRAIFTTQRRLLPQGMRSQKEGFEAEVQRCGFVRIEAARKSRTFARVLLAAGRRVVAARDRRASIFLGEPSPALSERFSVAWFVVFSSKAFLLTFRSFPVGVRR
jgi:hypothetical protein